MIKKIKLTLANAALVFAAAVLPMMAVSGVVSAEANIEDSLNKGACLNVSDPNCGTESPDEAVDNIISTVINVFSLVVGVISVVMIIVGGLKYITSGGDSGNVSGAKNTILYAIIGLVVVALAQVIVRFVLGQVSET